MQTQQSDWMVPSNPVPPVQVPVNFIRSLVQFSYSVMSGSNRPWLFLMHILNCCLPLGVFPRHKFITFAFCWPGFDRRNQLCTRHLFRSGFCSQIPDVNCLFIHLFIRFYFCQICWSHVHKTPSDATGRLTIWLGKWTNLAQKNSIRVIGRLSFENRKWVSCALSLETTEEEVVEVTARSPWMSFHG